MVVGISLGLNALINLSTPDVYIFDGPRGKGLIIDLFVNIGLGYVAKIRMAVSNPCVKALVIRGDEGGCIIREDGLEKSGFDCSFVTVSPVFHFRGQGSDGLIDNGR